ncbi:MAG TPA: SAM-dependent methyltransferase [Balneolaceae bacterium]|nr:SAM-dependent methyltransferase [Balneolaceae bacterium]
MKEFWNERFSSEEYIYGTEPNLFFKSELDKRTPGDLLMPAEGEGRNAVYAANNGWNVTAFDYSTEARKKAMQLAEKSRVDLTYHVGDFEQLPLKPESFDAIGLIFAHFRPSKRSHYHRAFIDLLKPGGIVILEAFSKDQLTYSSKNPKAGGPKKEEVLFSEQMIAEEFSGLNIHRLTKDEVELAEGEHHVGKSSVIRFIGEKPA